MSYFGRKCHKLLFVSKYINVMWAFCLLNSISSSRYICTQFSRYIERLTRYFCGFRLYQLLLSLHVIPDWLCLYGFLVFLIAGDSSLWLAVFFGLLSCCQKNLLAARLELCDGEKSKDLKCLKCLYKIVHMHAKFQGKHAVAFSLFATTVCLSRVYITKTAADYVVSYED